MEKITNFFNDEMKCLNENKYLIGLTMILGGFQAVLHALIPGILTKSASDKIKKLNEFVTDRS